MLRCVSVVRSSLCSRWGVIRSIATRWGTIRSIATRVSIKDSEMLELPASDVRICGWVRSVRKQKEIFFIDVNDGSCLRNLQVIASSNLSEATKRGLSLGCSVDVVGELCESPATGQKVEMTATELKILGECDAKEYPFKARKRHLAEYTRLFPHLRARTNGFSSVLRVRNTATMAVHRFFQEKGFLLINTPILTSSDCEGAGELFHVKPVSYEKATDFFGCNAFLAVSGQLHAETMACAMSSVYTFGPTFRAEKSHTRRHLSEFYMIEAEMVTVDGGLAAILEIIEGLYKYTVDAVMRTNNEELELFHKHITSSPVSKTVLRDSLEKPFIRITYTEAIDILTAKKDKFQFEPKWGADLQSEHEQFITSHCGNQPVFITDFPAAIKPFYARATEDDHETVSSVDLLVPGVGEVVGGTLREERLDVLTSRLERLDLLQDYQWYLDLRRFGTVPHGGFGMGLERLLQAILGVENIRDVIPFPRFLGSCVL